MLEYRIPIAQVISGVITAGCYLAALLIINQQRASRSRAFALLGVTLVFASVLVNTANGSIAGAYGRDTAVFTAGLIAVVVLAVAGVVLLALAVAGASTSPVRGRIWVLEAIGSLLILLGVVARFAFQWISQTYLGQADTESVINVLTRLTVVGGLLTGAGLVLVTRAVVLAGRRW